MVIFVTSLVAVSIFGMGYLAGGMNQSSKVSDLTDELLEAKREIDDLKSETTATDLFIKMDEAEQADRERK